MLKSMGAATHEPARQRALYNAEGRLSWEVEQKSSDGCFDNAR